MPVQEATISGDAIKALRDRYPDSYFKKVGASNYGLSGSADIFCCMAPEGRCLWIEMKTPEAYQSSATHDLRGPQILFGQRILEAGGAWAIAYSVQTALLAAEQCRDRAFLAGQHEMLNEARIAQELKRSERAKKAAAKRPPTAEQINKRLWNARRTRRTYKVPEHMWEAYRRPVIEG